MEYDRLKTLLNRYLEAETTVEEEQWLAKYVKTHQVPEEFTWAKVLFDYTANQKAVEVLSIEKDLKSSTKLLRIAASVALIIVTCFGVYRLEENHKEKQLQLAYQHTREAFDLIAEQMNKAANKASYLTYYEQSINTLIND